MSTSLVGHNAALAHGQCNAAEISPETLTNSEDCTISDILRHAIYPIGKSHEHSHKIICKSESSSHITESAIRPPRFGMQEYYDAIRKHPR